MNWSQIRRTAVVALLAFVTILGVVAAPVTAIDAGDATDEDDDPTAIDDAPTTTNTTLTDTTQTDTIPTDTTQTNTSQTDGPVPEVVCTDVTGLVHEEVPYDQVLWVDDLPQGVQDNMQPSALPGYDQLPKDARPPGVPWTILTPRAVAGIALSAAPNQCDVADPNDPPYDPREDDLDPDGNADVVEETEDGTTLVVVNGTLNRSAAGPGGESTIEFDAAEDGEVDPEASFNDGEKDYGVDPGLQYWSDGTIYAESDVTVIGMTAGGEVDCIGEECNLDVRGAPGLVEYPSIPSHSTDDPRDDTDEGTSGTADSGHDDSTAATGSPNSDGQSTDATGDTSSSNDATSSDDASDGAGDSNSDGSGEAADSGDEQDQAVVAAQDPPERDGTPTGGSVPVLGSLGAMSLVGLTLIRSQFR